jgi:hypothetical protein
MLSGNSVNQTWHPGTLASCGECTACQPQRYNRFRMLCAIRQLLIK